MFALLLAAKTVAEVACCLLFTKNSMSVDRIWVGCAGYWCYGE